MPSYLNSSYSVADILAILDEADFHDPYNNFFNLEHPYVYNAGSSLTLFANDEHWAIVFEKSGFSPRSGYPGIELYYFGNCLINLDKAGAYNQFTHNVKYIPLIDPETVCDITEGEGHLNSSVKSIKIHGNLVSVNQNPKDYERLGIMVNNFENPHKLIDYRSLVRYLADTNSESLLAPEYKLRMCLPDNLPRIIRINKWHHKQYLPQFKEGIKPSDYETYRMIADVLVTKNPACWKPTLPPNNDWRNWPEAGRL